MDRKLRIAYGRINQETHAFSPVETTISDFERQLWMEGEALEKACTWLGNEAPGWTPIAELSGFVAAARKHRREVEPVPLFSTWALPAGPVTEETYHQLRGRLIGSLRRAGPLDGVFFALHGAMRARGAQPEPEEGFLEAIREVVGDETPVAITLDLHAQLTPAMVERADLIQSYLTNPHRDLFQVGRRAGEALIQTALGKARPVCAWRSLPMVLGGGTTVDLFTTMRPIFRRMKAMMKAPEVLGVSLNMCHIWNDSPDLGWSVYAVTDGDKALAERLADEIADLAWAARLVQPPDFVSPEAAISAVRGSRVRRRTGPFCLVDASDVCGAGATGENTHLLLALLSEGRGLRALVPLLDAEAVSELWSEAEGAEVSMRVGGRLDPEMYPPVQVRGRVATRRQTAQFGRAVVLDLAHVQLVLTERPPYNLRPAFFTDVGLNPLRADIVVVKSFFHFRIFYLPLMRGSFTVRTRGLTDLDLVRQIKLRRPVHPLQEVAHWRP